MKNQPTLTFAVASACTLSSRACLANSLLSKMPSSKQALRVMVAFLFLLEGVDSWGQLLQWNTFGNLGTETTEPSVFNATGIQSSNLTLGAGVTPTGNANRFGGNDWFDTGNTSPTTLVESVADNDYIEFIVTPDAGYVYTPTAFEFRWGHSATGVGSVALRSSADGYVADLGLITGISESGFETNTITIFGLTNLSSPTTFRLYGYGATGASGSGGYDVGSNIINVALLGTSNCKVRNTNSSLYYCSLQAAIDAADPNDNIELLADITEGLIIIDKTLSIDGNGFTINSTSPTYGINPAATGISIQDLTLQDAGTYGIQTDCGADFLLMTNVTVNSSGNTGVSIYGSDNCTLNNITSTNNGGNGVNVTNCDNTTITGITTSGNAFMSGFNAGIGLFTSGTYCLPAGLSGFTLGGTVSIAEATKVYSQKANAADLLTGVSGATIGWAVGIGALDRSYWIDKPTAYAVVDALFEPPYNYPNTAVYVADVATENFYVDDDPAGDATPPMLIQTAITYEVPGKTIFLESGTFSERVILNKSLTLDGSGIGASVLDGTGLAGNGNGITLNTGITNVTIKDLTVRDYAGATGNTNAGIYGIGGNNNLTVTDVDLADNVGGSGFYANGPIDNVLLNNVDAHGHTIGARGIVIWNGLKSNITITNCEVYNNNCCGIELQDGTASGVTMTGNDIHDNGDNGIGVVGLEGPGVNSISSNTLLNNGRFGIEIKNPNGSGANSGAGSVVVSNNSVTRNVAIGDLRDISGIAVFRRGVLSGNVDVPNGVVVTNNTVTGYTQPSNSEGFGIVIEGTNHTATGNTITGNDVGLQQQAGHTPYPGDGDQSNLSDTYFGRGNSPMTCGNTVAPNTYSSNGTNTRNVGVGAGLVINTNTSENFCSIQAAIDDPQTINGHTITVAAGTYSENLIVNKSLTIHGANANINCASGRGAESIILGTGASGTITVSIQADNVVLNGFTIENPLGSYGVTLTGRNNVDIRYNIITDIGNATNGSGPSYGVAITMGSSANMDNVDVSENCISDIRGGEDISLTGLPAKNNNGSAGAVVAGFSTAAYDITNLTVTNNLIDNITACDAQFADGGKGAYGILINVGANASFAGKAVNALVQNNEMTNLAGHWSHGVGLEGETPGAQVLNNLISNLTDTKGNTDALGVMIEQNDGAASVDIHDNSFTAMAFGIKNLMTPIVDAECNWYGSANGGIVAAMISGNVDYTPWVVSGTDDLPARGFQPVAGSCSGTPVTITSATPDHIICGESSGSIAVIFSGGTSPFNIAWTGGSAMGVSSPYTITSLAAGVYGITVTDANGSTGTAGATILNLPVTNVTQTTYHATIQDAIDAASTSDAIVICAGIYTENIVVSEEVSLTGAGQVLTTILPAVSDPNCGGMGGGSLCPGSSNVMVIQANNVNISNLTIDGNNPSLTSGILSNGVDVDARNGIITNHALGVYNNLVVNNVEVKNIYLRGMYASSGGTFTFSNNTVTNVAGEFASIAMFNWLGSGSFTNNTVSNSNDAIASNHSTGCTYTGNVVTQCGSGIHTDNNGDSGGVADVISGNSVSNGTANSYGIFTFAPYFNVVVQENTLTNLDVALACAGSYTPGVITTFTRNTIDAQNRAGSTGMYATTMVWGYTPGNNEVVFTNNFVMNTAGDAFYLETDATYTLDFTANNNSITGNVNGVNAEGAGTLVQDFTCNWWGSNIYNDIEAAVGEGLNFIPVLVNGTDDAPMTAGFQPVAGACQNLGPVHNITQNTYFFTIQSAINDPTTVNGDVIEASAGTYPERVTINKQITLQGEGSALTILDGTGLAGTGSGITINPGITNVTIKDLTIRDYAGATPNTSAGIYGVGGNNNLTVTDVDLADNIGGSGFYANGPINNVLLNNVDAHGHTNINGAARGIVIWNGHKSNITITNCEVYNNNCCGIELQDGSASGVTMSNNNVHDNWDNGIGLIGLDNTTANNLVDANTLTNNGRFGIEIKNPNGNGTNTVVSNNNVTQSASFVSLRPSEVRDIAGIAVFRRGVIGSNVDVPNGVRVINNTVSGYIQDNGASVSEGFGIVIEGTNHTATGNIINNNDIGLQQQAGHTPYPGDGDQNNLADSYFGRGNSPMTCGNSVAPNTYAGNGANTRNINVGGGLVTNTTTMETFCSIQSAIDDPGTINGHTLSIADGTYNENVTITKELTLTGGGNGSNPVTNTVLTPSSSCSGAGLTISAANVTIQNMYVTNYQDAVLLNGVANPTINNMALVDYCRYGVNFGGNNSSVQILQSNIERTSFLANTVGIRVGTANAVNGLLINNSSITGNALQGIVVFQASVPVAFDNITITNSTISDNLQKGMYFEKLSNALFSNITMNNNGTDPTYGFNNGIDINLKYGNYANITIEDSDITNSGLSIGGDPENASVIAIKARDDSPSYNGNPATLTSVTIINNRITGPQNGIRFGEFGKINNTPSNVLVEGNDLSFPFAHKAIIRRTNDDLNMLCNWHGSTSLPVILATFAEAGTGSTILSSILLTGGDGNPAVGFQPSGMCGCPSGNLVTNTNTPETFCTIQAAIDDPDTDAGDIITVGPGTYIENIVLNKGIQLRGNNYGINPNTGMRGPESIIVPATSDPDPNSPTAVNIMYLTAGASGAVIDGFIIDGDNPSLTSPVNINGANIDAIECIAGYDGTGNLTISNNILQNVSYAGVDMYNYYNSGGVTSGNFITNNKIDNIAQSPYGIGVLVYNNFYAAVEDNVITRVRVGVQTGNFYAANTGATNSISNNAIQAERRGIFHNLAYGAASSLTIDDNVITTVPGSPNHLGISLSSLGGTVGAVVTDNDIDGAYAGVDFWNCTSSPAITVTGGLITNCNYGVVASNYDGYNADANSSAVRISGVTITGSTVAAVHVKDNPLNSNGATINLTVENDCEINGTGQMLTGILVSGPQASATVQGNDASINGFAIGIDVDGGSATITNNHIYDNGIGVRFTNAGFGTVHTNKFHDALRNGRDIQSTLSGGAVIATPNNWFAGTTFGVENLSSLSLDATASYWNNASGPGPVGPGAGANITTNVLYCPWLDDVPVALGDPGPDVLSSPTVSIVISETSGLSNNDGTICAGAFVLLDATTPGAVSYLWSGGQTTASINVSPAVTTAYSVTVTFAGCTDEAMVTITVDPLPVVSGPSAVCVGSMIQMLPSSGGTWTSGNPLLASIDMNTGLVTGVAAGGPVTFTFTQTSTGCSNTTGPVTVNPLPSAVITAPAFVWENTPGYAASVPDAGVGATYVWTASSGSITSGTPAVTFTSGLAPTMMINVTVTDANGCSSTGSFNVNVLPACLSIDFDDPVLLSNTQQLGYWYTDRYNPNGFVGQATAPDMTPNTLHVSINAADGQVSGFYNTQGRKHDLIDGTQSIQADLYIPAAWSSTNRRMAGMWGTGFDISNAVSAYPIIEFTSDGTNPRFRVWESGTGVFVDLGLPSGFVYDNWVTLRTQLLPSGEFLFTLETDQGDLQYTTTTSAPDATIDILNVILQGHNTTAGVTYDIFWDNFKASTTSSPVLTAPAIVFENTGGYTASIPDAGMGSTYVWTLSDGTIDSGAGTNSISFTSGDSPSMVISVLVTPANGCPASASATLSVLDECQMIDFSNPLLLGNTQATGVWYKDRYNPFGFAAQSIAPDATPNTLHVSINAVDGQAAPFYNTQGRKYDLIAGTQAIETDLYVPASWSSTGRRMAGMWGTAFDAGNNVSGFPILEYTSDGANPRFRVWESGTGVWVDLGLPPGFVYNKWVTLRTQLLASGEFYYTVVTEQGTLQYTTNTSAPDASVDIVNVILQGHNTTAGVTYDIYWDNFKSTTILTPVLEINNTPIANNGISTHCIGDMVTVEVTGGTGTYEIEYDGNIVHTGNVGDAGYGFTAIINLAGVYTVTVEDPDGCVSVSNFTLVVNICADPSAFQWVPDNSAHGSCPGTTDCCADIICFGLEYTPGVTGNLTSYTTGFFANCLGGMTPIASNLSCVMTDNSFEINQCMAIDSILFNSSGNGGSVPVMAGTPIILHKVCFNLSAGESIEIREDNVTNLSTSVDLTGGGLYTEFPSFTTPTVLTKPLPVIPSNVTVTVSCESNAVLPTPPAVLDYCGNPVPVALTSTVDMPMPVTCEGTRVYNFTYTDCAGNTYPWSHTYNIDDNVNPTASNPLPINVECFSDIPAFDLSVVTDEADNCGGTPVVSYIGDNVSSVVCDGATVVVTRTYRVTDCANNFIDVYQTITVDDMTNPTASNPSDINVQCFSDIPGQDPSVVTDEADNCDGAGTITVTWMSDNISSVTCDGDVVTVVRTYKVQDCSGNFILVTQNINVDDTTNPTASNPSDINVQCFSDIPGQDPSVVTDEADNCDGAGTITVTWMSDNVSSVTCDGDMVTVIRTYKVQDCSGNFILVTQNINVDDTTNPTASNPSDINVQCFSDIPGQNPSVVTDEADNCDGAGAITVTWISDNISSVACDGDVVTVVRTYKVQDCSGNFILVTQNINVDDTTNPTASNPSDINVQCFSDIPGQDPSVVTDEADNCDGAGTITVTWMSDNISSVTCDGDMVTVIRTYKVQDCSGNFILVTQNINVDDVTPPSANTPAPISVECFSDIPTPNPLVVTGETDNCDGTPGVAFLSDNITSAVCDGATVIVTRTYRVTDCSGNVFDVFQTINVDDMTNPTASNPPTTAVECFSDIPTPNPLVVTDEADNCDGAPIVTHIGDDINSVMCDGATISVIRTYQVADCSGNFIQVTQTFNVNDVTPPAEVGGPVPTSSVVGCPLDAVAPDLPGAPAMPVVEDICGNVLTPSAPIQGGTWAGGCTGTITFTYTYTSCSGLPFNWVYTYTVDCDPLTLKVLLEGPYLPGTGTMHNDLHDDHLLPGQDKLLSPDLAIQLGAPWTPFGQPYNTAPWNYNGNTGLIFGDPSSPGAPMGVIPYDLDVVDWVLVTVRKNGLLPANNHWTCAGWVHQDGEVTFPESCGTLSLNGADNYYVMVQHRNHLGILSPAPALEPCSGYVIDWDFTASNSYQPTFRYGQKMVDTGVWAMHAANGDQLTSISAISSPDRTTWRLLQGVLGYSVGDYNMSSVVTPPDETVWKTNQNKTSGVIFY